MTPGRRVWKSRTPTHVGRSVIWAILVLGLGEVTGVALLSGEAARRLRLLGHHAVDFGDRDPPAQQEHVRRLGLGLNRDGDVQPIGPGRPAACGTPWPAPTRHRSGGLVQWAVG